MATIRTTAQRGQPSPNGQATRPEAVVRPPGKRFRGPELAIGLIVTGVFALGAALWHLSSVEKVPALAASTQIERGDVIDASDVRVIYVSSEDPLARLDDTQIDRVVGRVALIDIDQGTLLTPTAVADAAAMATGDGVVGLALDPGAYPSRGLVPGDRVHVVRATDTADPGATPFAVARNATVFEVQELASDRLLVSILTQEGDAEAVAASSGSGNLRLVLVAP